MSTGERHRDGAERASRLDRILAPDGSREHQVNPGRGSHHFGGLACDDQAAAGTRSRARRAPHLNEANRFPRDLTPHVIALAQFGACAEERTAREAPGQDIAFNVQRRSNGE